MAKNLCDKVSKIKNLRWQFWRIFRWLPRAVLHFFCRPCFHGEICKTNGCKIDGTLKKLVQFSVDEIMIFNITLWRKISVTKFQKQARAGVVPSSGLARSWNKVEVFMKTRLSLNVKVWNILQKSFLIGGQECVENWLNYSISCLQNWY